MQCVLIIKASEECTIVERLQLVLCVLNMTEMQAVVRGLVLTVLNKADVQSQWLSYNKRLVLTLTP